MPLPLIPIVAGVITAGSAAVAGKKGLDAYSNNKKANEIGKRAQQRHEYAIQITKDAREMTNTALQKLGRMKMDIFHDQIAKLVDEIKKRKIIGAKLKDFESCIDDLNLPDAGEINSETWAALGSGLLSGAAFGMAARKAAVSGVQRFALASTGTAISSLKGAALQRATLAALGGGSIATGGGGMALGFWAWNGVTIAPALAVTTWKMAAKAEEALTKAREYEAERDKDIAKLVLVRDVFAAVRRNVQQAEKVIKSIASDFDRMYEQLQINNIEDNFHQLCDVGTALKKVLDTPIINVDGTAVEGLDEKYALHMRSSGFIEYR
ncbi:MAG: hypothetical protein IJM64_01505 [Ottowia sp.]|nr:hypothetical protein [Ottowia sp.]